MMCLRHSIVPSLPCQWILEVNILLAADPRVQAVNSVGISNRLLELKVWSSTLLMHYCNYQTGLWYIIFMINRVILYCSRVLHHCVQLLLMMMLLRLVVHLLLQIKTKRCPWLVWGLRAWCCLLYQVLMRILLVAQ